MKIHGDARWQAYPGYLNVVVPRVLKFLDEMSLKITFFVVGQDAALPQNQGPLRMIPAAGHEIGNHSFHHEPWLHLYSTEQLHCELAMAEDAIHSACGVRPVGFRGPGFSISGDVINVLSQRGYDYDASTFPTIIGPLARAYYLMSTRLSAEEKQQRRKLFGSISDGFRPLHPYLWGNSGNSVLEIPVTTIPCLRTPFHLSYLVYLSQYSFALSRSYLQVALLLCRARGVEPSFLLHPLDFLGPAEAPELDFFPGMKLSLEYKLSVAKMAIDSILASFAPLTMSAHAALHREPSLTAVLNSAH